MEKGAKKMKKCFRKALSLLMASSLVLGMAVTAHAADDSMTRGEMAALLVEGAGLSDQVAAYAAKPSAFADVAEGSQYEGAINLAYAKGLISGTGAGKFSPDAKATQVQAAAVLLKAYGVPGNLMTAWPADYNEMAKWSGLTDGVNYDGAAAVSKAAFSAMLTNAAAVADKPVIGLSWAYDEQAEEYVYYKAVIKEAGGIPVELAQITSTAVGYDAENDVLPAYLEDTGMLKVEYAKVIKSGAFEKTNIEEAMVGIDGVFFTGGEDISPSLFATPVPEANEGEAINATRDISDYTLMDYCIENDIPSLAACRGEQMMGIVSGCTFNQDIPNYYEAEGKTYNDTHRMPVGVPNRDYARHDVEIAKDSKWLYDIVGSTTLENVSSWHHQAVMDVAGTNLTVVASTEADGIEIIEALERQDKTFCLGVQFHPENDCGLVLVDGVAAPCDYDTCLQFFETLVAYAADKPVIGISWKSNSQNYEGFKEVIRAAGGIPVEMPQITSTAVKYDETGKIDSAYIEETGNLKEEYAEIIKKGDFSKSNVAAAVDFKDVDGMFFTGGEDVSPSLFAVSVPEANEGEEINATRDISDYTLMDYCIEQDIPTFGVCRGEQVLGIVSGCTFNQDIPNYYEAAGKTYNDMHRMPVGTPNRTYARHAVTIDQKASKWLYDIVGSTTLDNVSSWHHQAVMGVEGTKLTVVASAEHNGIEIIEGIERQDKTFCLGVQFHPENDCKLALYDGTPELALCNLDVCMNFFYTLIEYAGK